MKRYRRNFPSKVSVCCMISCEFIWRNLYPLFVLKSWMTIAIILFCVHLVYSNIYMYIYMCILNNANYGVQISCFKSMAWLMVSTVCNCSLSEIRLVSAINLRNIDFVDISCWGKKIKLIKRICRINQSYKTNA